MQLSIADWICLAAALGSGLIGGVFFAFSTFVMAALARRPPPEGIAAMQAINETVLNGWFLGTFFGTGLLSVALLVLASTDLSGAQTLLIFGAGALYIGGSIGVTIAANVPLNNELKAVRPESAEGHAVWRRYLVDWTRWNHVRTAASAATALLFAIAAALPPS